MKRHQIAFAIPLIFILYWTYFLIDELLFLFTSIIFIILGAFLYILFNGLRQRTALLYKLNFLTGRQRFSQGLFSILRERLRFKDLINYKEKHSMTGFDNIDSIIEQILQYVMRDYVDTWYTNISADPFFQESVMRSARRTIAAFSHCVKKVDWTPLLTRHFVDDFASHLRLYRKAKENLLKQKTYKPDDLESVFFDLELEMEKCYCRDLVSTSPVYETAYLHDIVDILLFLLMPPEDFRSRPLRFLVREIIVTKIIVPALDKLSDPLYVNYLIVWLLSELPIVTEDFVTSLETCQSCQELESVLESVHEEIVSLRSKEAGINREHADSFKQQLTSLEFAELLIKRRMVTLANRPEVLITDQADSTEKAADTSVKILHLPLRVVLTHQTAVSFFVDFLAQIGAQNYIDFYLSIEGFKVSVEHQLRALASGETVDSEVYETVKEAALFMYRQYLSQEASGRVPLDESIVNRFLARVRNDEPFDTWFEQIQERLEHQLGHQDRFYPAFKRHPLYVCMLEELGILREGDDELNGDDEVDCEEFDALEESHGEDVRSVASTAAAKRLSRDSFSSLCSDVVVSERVVPFMKSGFKSMDQCVNGSLKAVVEILGVGQQGKQMFALYNVRVRKTDANGRTETWNVIRRYSDFYTLNMIVNCKFPGLKSIIFPSKKTFNNLDQVFLMKRCEALNMYIDYILQPSVLHANPGLEAELFNFLTQESYKGSVSNNISKKVVSAMFTPIMSGMRAFGSAVTAMPDQVFDGIGKVGSELNRAANQVLKSADSSTGSSVGAYRTGNSFDSNRVAAHLNDNESDSIPLRVLLLFVDEVFGLRGRNQWFRRRLVTFLKQFVNAALGSSINKRIIDVVQWLTSSDQVAQYLSAFRDSIWNETKASEPNPTSEALRTRFLTRCLMLSALPDELRLFIGASTTINGINNISEALQNHHLNRRFWYVIMERLLATIFQNNRFDKVFPILHSKSPRARFSCL